MEDLKISLDVHLWGLLNETKDRKEKQVHLSSYKQIKYIRCKL